MRRSRTALGFLAALVLLVAPAVSSAGAHTASADLSAQQSNAGAGHQHGGKAAHATGPATREHQQRSKHAGAPALPTSGAALPSPPVSAVAAGTWAGVTHIIGSPSHARAPPFSV